MTDHRRQSSTHVDKRLYGIVLHCSPVIPTLMGGTVLTEPEPINQTPDASFTVMAMHVSRSSLRTHFKYYNVLHVEESPCFIIFVSIAETVMIIPSPQGRSDHPPRYHTAICN